MLITELKSHEDIKALATGKTFVISCFGCKEVHFPEEEAVALTKELGCKSALVDYICNPENLALRLAKYKKEIDAADKVLVFSCGVGVQTVSAALENKKVLAGCDTFPLPGFQGVTPLEFDCDQCGECYLNKTGGICPITACSKGLVNGQCGGAKNGKCEVDKDMECGWERIYRRLESQNRIADMKQDTQIRNFATNV